MKTTEARKWQRKAHTPGADLDALREEVTKASKRRDQFYNCAGYEFRDGSFLLAFPDTDKTKAYGSWDTLKRHLHFMSDEDYFGTED